MFYLHQIDSVAFHVGPLPIRWYGLTYLAGFGLAYWLGLRRVKAGRFGITTQAYSDLIFYAAMGVILGGRVGYVLFYDFAGFVADPLSLLRVWDGGMSFHGGLLGVLAAIAWWSRAQRIAFWDTVDFIAPLVPPGLGFGRLANFINGELWGKLTDGTWGVVFPGSLPGPVRTQPQLLADFQSGALNSFARHPSQIYQFLLEGVVLFTVLYWYSAKPRPRYAVSGLFGVMYGTFRFIVEFVRVPDASLGYLAFGWLTMGQLLSFPLILLGVFLLYLSRRAPVRP
jgi:phosphatidylglycerol---prolipoprotein diacylglyceryl transferase